MSRAQVFGIRLALHNNRQDIVFLPLLVLGFFVKEKKK